MFDLPVVAVALKLPQRYVITTSLSDTNSPGRSFRNIVARNPQQRTDNPWRHTQNELVSVATQDWLEGIVSRPNVSGNRGVQIEVSNGKRLLIGSRRAEELWRAIQVEYGQEEGKGG